MSLANDLSIDYFDRRIKSFDNYPNNNVSTNKLAEAGFIYTNQSDLVICDFCKLKLDQWVTGDDPVEEHKKHRPDCPFVKKYITKVSTDIVDYTPTVARGIPERSNENYRCFLMPYKKRLDTFSTWPKNLLPKPKDLAQAGFYYTGHGDRVICHDCGVGLNEWEPEDNPWVEHKKYSPDCGFLQNKRRFWENASGATKKVDEEETSEDIPRGRECVVCLTNERNILSLPCRHFATCEDCNDKTTVCPICKREEEQRIKVYNP